MEQDTEYCAAQLQSVFFGMCVLAVCRAPTGDFEKFVNKVDYIINHLYKPKAEFVICGGISTDFCTVSHSKQCLISPLP